MALRHLRVAVLGESEKVAQPMPARLAASDYVSTTADAARLGYAVYGPPEQWTRPPMPPGQPPLLSRASQRAMVPTNPFYGLATFNLSDQVIFSPIFIVQATPVFRQASTAL